MILDRAEFRHIITVKCRRDDDIGGDATLFALAVMAGCADDWPAR